MVGINLQHTFWEGKPNSSHYYVIKCFVTTWASMVVHTFNPSTQASEARGTVSSIQANQVYVAKPCLKKQNRKKKTLNKSTLS